MYDKLLVALVGGRLGKKETVVSESVCEKECGDGGGVKVRR